MKAIVCTRYGPPEVLQLQLYGCRRPAPLAQCCDRLLVQAAPCLPWPGYVDNPPSDLIQCSPSAALVRRRCARTRGPRVA